MKVDFFIKPSQVLSRTSGLVPEHHSVISHKPLTRRQLLMGMAGVGTALGVAACTRSGSLTGQAEVTATESARPTTGTVRTMTLNPRPVNIDLGGRIASTWAYGDTVPGKPLRATAGDRVQVAVRNDLPESTSVHWHGLAIRNDMDGVPGVTTPAIDSGGTFDFDFVVPDPGTHWFHPHTGLQLDRGLYAPFIIDNLRELVTTTPRHRARRLD
jgi:FtsP/CotA-like multicopper oxidase with cupredoxin domain